MSTHPYYPVVFIDGVQVMPLPAREADKLACHAMLPDSYQCTRKAVRWVVLKTGNKPFRYSTVGLCIQHWKGRRKTYGFQTRLGKG